MKKGLLILSIMLISAFSLTAKTPKIAMLGFTSDKNQAHFEKYVKFLSKVIYNNFMRVEQIKIIEDSSAQKAVAEALKQGKDLRSALTIYKIGKKLGVDMVLSGYAKISPDGRFVIITGRMLDVNKKRFLKKVVTKDLIQLQNIVIGTFVNQLVSRVKSYYKIKNDGAFTETNITLEQKDRIKIKKTKKIKEKKKQPVKIVKKIQQKKKTLPPKNRGFNKDLTLNTIFSFRKTMPFFDNEASSVFGIDFIFDVEGSEYGFGFAINIIETNFMAFDLFFEFHALKNNYNRHWQFYLRTGPGIVYPLKPEGSFDIKLTTMLGTRYAFSYFIFDVGVGIEYFRSQTSSIFARAGAGFHF